MRRRCLVIILLLSLTTALLRQTSSAEVAQSDEPLRRVSSGRIAYDTFSASDGAATDIPWTVDQLDPLQGWGSMMVEGGMLSSVAPLGGAFWAHPTGLELEDYVLEARVRPILLNKGGPQILVRYYSGDRLAIEASFGYHHSDQKLRVIVIALTTYTTMSATTDEATDFAMAAKNWYTFKLVVSWINMMCYVDSALIFNVTDGSVGTLLPRRPYLGGFQDGEWGYWDDFKVYKADNITISNLRQGQRVELYDDSDRLRASDQVEPGESKGGLDVSALTFPFKGYFKIYDADGASLLCTTPVYEDVWGGDRYVFSLYGPIKAETQVEAMRPLSAQMTIHLQAERDGSAVEGAEVMVDGVRAEDMGGGVYRAVLTTWMPLLRIKVTAEKFGYEPATIQTTHYLLGNFAIEGGLAVIGLLVFLKFCPRRGGKDQA